MGFDKLEAEVAGRPLLAWTLERIAGSPLIDRIVVVTAPDRVERVKASGWLPASAIEVVPGGARRHESVAAGLAALPARESDEIVLVHDGARPVVTLELIARVVEAVHEHGAAVPVLPIRETVKRLAPDGTVVETVDRANLAAAQTPQGARAGILRDAFERYPPSGLQTWTDEAALLEACNIPVRAIDGNEDNIKVTLPGDLARVEQLLGGVPRRVGFGSDSHPFGPGTPLALGGIRLDGAPRLHGHSDGDVALHAVADALLGGAGMGDLGRLFPAGPATAAGIASTELLAGVVDGLAAAGLRPVSVDLTIVAARPPLAGSLEEMRGAIARLLGLPAVAVNVKASTGNLAGMEGAGRGISAQAVAVVDRVR
jgi:2-C-methyl-D-erythritol 4-phosphate cytidylyltransferase/2-C-methyl-D-erythritol 2,4-cyclodiphosphate synthase